jgi:hypothetical protein
MIITFGSQNLGFFSLKQSFLPTFLFTQDFDKNKPDSNQDDYNDNHNQDNDDRGHRHCFPCASGSFLFDVVCVVHFWIRNIKNQVQNLDIC